MSLHLVKSGRGRVIVASDDLAGGLQSRADSRVAKLFQAGKHTVCGYVGYIDWYLVELTRRLLEQHEDQPLVVLEKAQGRIVPLPRSAPARGS
jgi:hypothetical protein